MGKRIYNGVSGVMPASTDLQEQNRAANKAAWERLSPSTRAMYLRKMKEEQAARQAAGATGKGVSH